MNTKKYFLCALLMLHTFFMFNVQGRDIFALCEPNEENQYVFVNSMLIYQFAEFFYETSFYNYDNHKERLKFIVYIDSAKRSRVLYQDESFGQLLSTSYPNYKNL